MFLGSTQNLYYRAATYNRRALTLALTRRVVVKPLSRVHRANLKRKELIQTRGIHGEMRGRLMANGEMKRRKPGFLRSFGIDRLWYCHSVRTITCYQVTVYERMKDGAS